MRGMREREIDDDTTPISPLVWIIPLIFFCGVVLGAILCDAGVVYIK